MITFRRSATVPSTSAVRCKTPSFANKPSSPRACSASKLSTALESRALSCVNPCACRLSVENTTAARSFGPRRSMMSWPIARALCRTHPRSRPTSSMTMTTRRSASTSVFRATSDAVFSIHVAACAAGSPRSIGTNAWMDCGRPSSVTKKSFCDRPRTTRFCLSITDTSSRTRSTLAVKLGRCWGVAP